MSQPLLDAFADLIGSAEFRPELFVLVFPIRPETFVEIVTQLVEQPLPGRFAALVRTQQGVQAIIQFRQRFLGQVRDGAFADVLCSMTSGAKSLRNLLQSHG